MRIFQPLLSGLLVLATAGCSLLQSESPRFTLASDEGKYVYTDPSTLPKEQIFQAADHGSPSTSTLSPQRSNSAIP